MSRSAALKILLSIRLSASLWSIISDCDEVYNYWEPLHLVLFGRGFQTWEYAPDYAIRSWLYVLLYALPSQPLLYLIGASSKLALFFAIRFLIGLVCLFAELSLYESVCRRADNSVGRAFLLFTLLSPAMFSVSCAFLPSSFSMATNALTMAMWLREKCALLGWPFAALLGVPIVVQMVLLRPQLVSKFLLFSALSCTILLALLCAVYTHFFGKFVIAPLNIVMYNLFSANGLSQSLSMCAICCSTPTWPFRRHFSNVRRHGLSDEPGTDSRQNGSVVETRKVGSRRTNQAGPTTARAGANFFNIGHFPYRAPNLKRYSIERHANMLAAFIAFMGFLS